jgi:1-acyl-sn-glycerol-3-phosphate acyltransferase
MPLAILPNHVNAFIDPVVVGMLPKRKIRFFARGDIFKGKLAKWFFESMNISPMFRLSEGYSELKKNDRAFDECRLLLSQKKAILLFPEGICVQTKRIEKLKKGTARILLGVEESANFHDDIRIVPVGLNYSRPTVFRSRLFVNIGPAIPVSGFKKRYAEDKVKAINEFTQFIENELTKQVIVVKDPGNDELYEGIAEIYVKQWMQEEGLNTNNQEAEHSKNLIVARMINHNQMKSPLSNESMKLVILPYLAALKTLKLRDHLLRKDALVKMSIKSILNDFFILWFGLPVYWIGLLLNFPPYYISQKVAKEKALKIEFYASVHANLGMILWVIYYLVQLVFITSLFHNWILTGVWALLTPITGYFCLHFYAVSKKIFGRWRLLGLVKKNRSEAERLILEREEIVQMIRSEILLANVQDEDAIG